MYIVKHRSIVIPPVIPSGNIKYYAMLCTSTCQSCKINITRLLGIDHYQYSRNITVGIFTVWLPGLGVGLGVGGYKIMWMVADIFVDFSLAMSGICVIFACDCQVVNGS